MAEQEQRFIDIPIVALPPPGAVTVILLDEHGHYAAQWVTRELLEDAGPAGISLQQLALRNDEQAAERAGR